MNSFIWLQYDASISESRASRSELVETQLTELICKARVSMDSRTRLAALQWASGLFKHSPLALHTALMLSSELM